MKVKDHILSDLSDHLGHRLVTCVCDFGRRTEVMGVEYDDAVCEAVRCLLYTAVATLLSTGMSPRKTVKFLSLVVDNLDPKPLKARRK